MGRDPTLELVSVNPLVSRQCHGVITSDQGGATYVDQSRRGTFLDGKPVSGPLRITESVVLRLGDPATGEELGITPPLTSTQIARNHGRRVLGGRMRRGALVGVAVAAVAGLATYGFFALRPASSGLSGGLSSSVLRHAEAATVRLLDRTPATATYSGSGTVISPTGLILTNSHVAQPSAPGLAVSLGQPQTDSNPPFLTVEMTTGPSSPVRLCDAAARAAFRLAGPGAQPGPAAVTRAFTVGLRDASLNGRVTEGTWRRVLLGLHDCVCGCPACGAALFYDPEQAGQCCWNCSAPLPVPVTLKVRGSLLVLSEGAVLTSHHLNRDRDYRTACAVVEPGPRPSGRVVLRNLTDRTWTVVPDGEEPKRVAPNQRLGVRPMRIDFGPARGQVL